VCNAAVELAPLILEPQRWAERTLRHGERHNGLVAVALRGCRGAHRVEAQEKEPQPTGHEAGAAQ
jgi:hypothetical protein